MKRILYLLMVFFAISILHTSCKIIAKIPTVPVQAIPYFPPPVSQINVDIKADLTKQIEEADKLVPRQLVGGADPCEGVRFHYDLRRDPLSFSGAGNVINLGLHTSFAVGAEYCAKCLFGKCVVPKISGSCGFGDGDPGFNIAFQSAINFLPTYQLQTLTKLAAFTSTGSCPVTILRINVLPIIQREVAPKLSELGAKVDQKVSSLNYASDVSRMWVQLSREMTIGNLGFLNINPQQLRLSTLNMAGKDLSISLGLACSPTLNTVSNPSPTIPLPDLSVCKLGDGLNLSTDILLDYVSMTKQLNAQVNGKSIKIGKKKFIFTNATISGKGNSKLVIAVYFKGCRKGILYFVGTPIYDQVTHKITVPDLDFSIETRSILLKLAAWLLDNRITSQLRASAQYDLTSILNSTRTSLEAALTRQIAPGVTSSCTITDLTIKGIFPTTENLIIRPYLKGILGIEIK